MKSFTAESVEPTSKSLEISKSGYKHQKVLHMSFSQIGCYLRCPFEFKLRHVFGFNPGIEVGIGFGKQVHFLLNFLHKDFKEKPSFENVEQLVDKMFFLRYSTGKAFQNMKKKALKIIWDYVQHNEEIFGNVIFAEKPFAHPIRGIDFFGIADLITKRDKGSIELMDFKTEVEAKPNPIYELQLRAYAIALNGAMGLDISNAFVYFLQTGNKVPVSLAAKHINETKDILGSVAESLHNRRFPPNKNQCASCDFKAFCPNLGLGHSPK